MPGISNIGMPPPASAHLDLDLLVVELAGAELLAERFARSRRWRWRRPARRARAPRRPARRVAWTSLRLRSRDQRDADLDQVADDLLDVAADIADLGELGRLDLDERRAGELGQPARDLGLADAGRADHQDVLRQHLLAQLVVELLAAPAVAQRDGDGALGVGLADDEAVELGDDLAGREVGHARSGSGGSLLAIPGDMRRSSSRRNGIQPTPIVMTNTPRIISVSKKIQILSLPIWVAQSPPIA